MPPALAAPSSAVVAPGRGDDELTLAALMDLFEPEDSDGPTPTPSTTRAARRLSASGLRTWRQERSLWSVKVTIWFGGSRRAR